MVMVEQLEELEYENTHLRHMSPYAREALLKEGIDPDTYDPNHLIVQNKEDLKLFENVHILNAEKQHKENANTYLVGGNVLVDPGTKSSLPQIFHNLYLLGIDPREIEYIVLTHYHRDHAEAVAFWQRYFNVQVIGCTVGMEEVGMSQEEKDEKKEMYNVVIVDPTASDLYDEQSVPFKVDMGLKGGEVLVLGSTVIKVWKTPGHTESCLTFEVTTKDEKGNKCVVFIVGDFFNGSCGIFSNLDIWYKYLLQLDEWKFEENPEVEAYLLPGHVTSKWAYDKKVSDMFTKVRNPQGLKKGFKELGLVFASD